MFSNCAGAEDREAVAADLELVQRDRPAGRQRGVGEEVDAGAERLGDLRVLGPDAGGEALDVDGDVAPGRVVEVLREAAEPERHVLHLDVGGLQAVEDDEAVPAGGVAVVHVQRGGMEPGAGRRGPAAPRPGRAGSPSMPVSGQVAQEAVGAGLEVAVEVEHGAGDVQRRRCAGRRRIS